MPLQQVDNVKLHLKEIYIIQSIMQGLGIPLASTAIPQCTYILYNFIIEITI